MQCSSCQFENMPGSDICGRCGTSLRLGDAQFDVHPPRAGVWQKRLRHVLPVGRAFSTAQRGWRHVAAAVPSVAWLPTVKDVLRLLVPGLPQLRYGRRRLGWLLLVSYILLLLGSLLTLGSNWSGVLFGLAFAVHSAGVFTTVSGDIVAEKAASRLQRSVALSIVLATLVYGPLLLGVSRVARPMMITISAAPFRAGDVLLSHRLGTPQVGSIVEYDIEPYRWQMGPRYMYGVIPGGPAIGRILAGPGSHVLFERGRFTVDGNLAMVQPLNPLGAPKRLELTVPQNRYFILPTLGAQLPPDDAWQTIGLVEAANIHSTIYFRVRPYSDFGPLQ